MPRRQRHQLFTRAYEERVALTMSAFAACWTNVAKAASRSFLVPALATITCCPRDRTAACSNAKCVLVIGLLGLIRMAIVVAVGTSSRSNSSRFGPSTPRISVTPVMLPPGRLRLATSPSSTGSPPVRKTIGMTEVADFAAKAAGKPVVTISATCRSRRWAARIGRRSYLAPAH